MPFLLPNQQRQSTEGTAPYTVPWDHMSQYPKQHLNRFRSFHTAHSCEHQTDRETDRQRQTDRDRQTDRQTCAALVCNLYFAQQLGFIKIKFSIWPYTDRDCGDVCCCRQSLAGVQCRTSAEDHVTRRVAPRPVSHRRYDDDVLVAREAWRLSTLWTHPRLPRHPPILPMNHMTTLWWHRYLHPSLADLIS